MLLGSEDSRLGLDRSSKRPTALTTVFGSIDGCGLNKNNADAQHAELQICKRVVN